MATIAQRIGANGLAINPGAFRTDSYVDSLTAHAGGGQGSATPLTAQINRISVCATAADSVILPSTATVTANPPGPQGMGGLEITVINSGAAACSVYPQSGDTINGGSANASISIPAGGMSRFATVTAGAWFTGTGGSSSVANQTVTGTLTAAAITGVNTETFIPQVLAAAGATQGAAGAITKSRVIVTVTASTQGVKLPTAATGLEVRVMVPGTVGVKVYPAANAKIDTAATNTAQALVAGKANVFLARDTTRWVTMKGA